TSSKSTKLVHGGIRYLPNFDFALVHEALVERGLLLQNAPYLVHPVGFVLPIYEGDRHPVGMPFTTPGGIGLNILLDIGLWIYDGMAGQYNIKRHQHLSRDKVLELAPTLMQTGLKEGFMYYDAQTVDARLTMALLRTAARYGAVLANYAEVTAFVTRDGTVKGAHIRDMLDGQELTIQARHVINATGVFAGKLEELTGAPPLVSVEPSKGVHLVLARDDLKLGDHAVVLPETEDKRILFIVPWESRAIFGTTDTGTGDLDHPVASPEDIAYLLKYLNRYLSIHLTEDNIISTYAGYRPLVKPHHTANSTANLSRSHVVLQSPSGLVTIVGGKMTTYRRMAQDTVDVISRRDGERKLIHPTEVLPLQGSAGWLAMQGDIARQGSQLSLTPSIIKHLETSYGTDTQEILRLIEEDATLGKQLVNDLPYIRAEVIYACRHSMAMTPQDVLARRTSLIMEDRQRGLGVVDDIASLMALEHGWSFDQQQQYAQQYRDSIAQQTQAEQVSQHVS
ncbi:MAG TPA: glycerol-3-phosphate dehydrogenase/oxidase, partial [Ktedonobacteraceae bacterium]